MEDISLLWENGIKKSVVSLSEDTKKDLDLDFICEHVTSNKQEQDWIKEVLGELTYDIETIQFRSNIFSDIMENKAFRKELNEVVTELKVLGEFNNIKVVTNDYSSIWDLINRLKELYAYINCIEKMSLILSKYQFHSYGINHLKEMVQEIYKGSGFEYLKQDIERLTEDVSKIKSITLGVNLDKNLNPCEVQLMSINKTVFTETENALLKAFVTSFAGSMAKTLLKTNKDEIDPLMNALTRRVEKMLEHVVNDLKASLNKYVNISGYAITKLIPEIVFYVRFCEMYEKIGQQGVPICKAELTDSEEFDKSMLHTRLMATDFYNIKLAIHKSENAASEDIITNNIIFDDMHMQYILTGPNRGGKTIFTQGVGLLFILAQNGLYVPAKGMKFTPVDNIFTHFPADENKTVEFGRLGEEAKRIESIIEQAGPASLVLLNESLSTTNFSEGLFIAKDVVKAFNYMGTRIIYNTHMHELAMNLGELNYLKTDNVVSLVMGIEGERRNYKAVIAPPTGNSYARDIAEKYGILFNQMKDVIDQKKDFNYYN